MLQAKPAKGIYRRNLPHLQAEGKTLFVTFAAKGRRELPESVRSLVMSHCIHDHGTKIWLHGAVVMPDHVHMIFTSLTVKSGNTYGLAEIMKGIKGSSARSVNKALGRKGNIWQDESFDHILRNDEKIVDKVNYICKNPVRKGLVDDENKYPWIWREWVEGKKKM